MIVEMKHLTLLCLASESESTLKSLRELGCVHLDLTAASSSDLSQARINVSDAEKALRIWPRQRRVLFLLPVREKVSSVMKISQIMP